MTVTVADVEREVAARCGRFFRYTATDGGASQVVLADEKSSLNLGGLKGLWLLRRGVMEDGTAIPGFPDADRQRRISTVDRDTGTLGVERGYTSTPSEGEDVEIVYLNPAQELRPAVLRGLRRCYFEHRASITLAGAAAERNLTDELAWLRFRWQVLGVQSAAVSGLDLPMAVLWDHLVESAGSVLLQGWPDPFPYALLVTALRPADTYVNGADSDTGPTADDDELAVDLEYAARAGHIEAWRTARAKMLQPAASGLAVTQAEAARSFSEIAAARVKLPPRRIGYAEPFTPDLSAVVV